MSLKQQIRIGYLAGTAGDWGGASRVLFNTIKLLDRKRYEPVVLLPRDGPIIPTLEELGVHFLIWGQVREPSRGTVQYIRDVVAAMRTFRRLRIDLLDVNFTFWRPAEVLAAKLLRIPVVTHYHVVNTNPGPFVRFSSALVAVSRFVAEKSMPKSPRTEVIYNFVTLERFDRAKDIRLELGLQPDDTVVSFVGQIRRQKGVDLFIRMAHSIPNPSVKFLIVGECRDPRLYEGSYSEEQLRHEIDGDPRIRYIGYRSDVENIFRSSDILVMPSRWGEPFGLINIEAGAAGKPMLATRDGGIPEVIRNGVNGLTVDVDDLQGLIRHAEELINDRALRDALGRKGREMVEKEFTTQPVRQLERLYEDLVLRRSRTSSSDGRGRRE